MLTADGDDIINSADDAAIAAVDDRAEFIDGIILVPPMLEELALIVN